MVSDFSRSLIRAEPSTTPGYLLKGPRMTFPIVSRLVVVAVNGSDAGASWRRNKFPLYCSDITFRNYQGGCRKRNAPSQDPTGKVHCDKWLVASLVHAEMNAARGLSWVAR